MYALAPGPTLCIRGTRFGGSGLGPTKERPVGSSHFSVSAASANEMVRKLERRGLMTYEPYRGVDLTDAGRRIAARVLRVRRLWARFLADRLGLTPEEADALACRLEHVTPDGAADRLDRFLDHPSVDPLGHPIPRDEGKPAAPLETLAEAPVGTAVGVETHRPHLLVDEIALRREELELEIARQAVAANILMMTAGFALMGFQIAGYLVS